MVPLSDVGDGVVSIEEDIGKVCVGEIGLERSFVVCGKGVEKSVTVSE
jgi:hypothetical protein